jgi:ankyrin repeat protein
VDVNIGDFHCRLPLSYASEKGYEGIVKLLLETGKAKTYSGGTVAVGGTPLACAIKGGYVGIVKLLMDTGKPNMHIPDQDGQTALSLAEAGGNDILKLLKPEGNTSDNK